VTDIDQLDLFSPKRRRERVVEWQEPAPVAKVAMGLSGMDAMLGLCDGRLPPPPFAKLIGFVMALVEPGRSSWNWSRARTSKIPSACCTGPPPPR
jgi:hypothetical protein